MSGSLRIVTGAPGTGKSAVLARLDGIATVAEPARQVLADYRAERGLAASENPNHAEFVSLLLERSIENYLATAWPPGPVVFDRGIPDCIAYAEWLGTDPAPATEAAERYRYDDEVLLFMPWRSIYTTDEERTMTFAMIEGFHKVLVDVYDRLGYRVVEVPNDTVEARAAFIDGRVSGDSGSVDDHPMP